MSARPRAFDVAIRKIRGACVTFGGVKNSNYGREGGRFSMEEMTEVKWVTVQRGQRGFPI